MELVKELLITLGRIVTIFPLLLAVTLWMGKRSIAELPVFDFLIVIALGAVVGADIADPTISHIHTGFAVVVISLLQVCVALLKLRYRKFGRWITFEPTVVIYKGHLLEKNVRSIRYSIDNVLQMLRENDVYHIQDVHLGIIEANGQLSVLKEDVKSAPVLEDMGLQKKGPAIAYPVMIDGKIERRTLQNLNVSEQWLRNELTRRNIEDPKHVFLATLDRKLQLHVTLKGKPDQPLPPIVH